MPKKRKRDGGFRVNAAAANETRGEGRAPGEASSLAGQARFPEGGVTTVHEGGRRQGGAHVSPWSPKKPTDVLRIQKRPRRDPPTTVSRVAEAPRAVGASAPPLAPKRWLMQVLDRKLALARGVLISAQLPWPREGGLLMSPVEGAWETA
jgi:hypothetical protein